MRARNDIMRELAPLLCAILLAGVAGWRTATRAPSADTSAYMARVAHQIDGLPYRIGNYIGVDASVTPYAVDLLDPNRILQRKYTDPETGEGFSLVIVHCKIAKDMTGHYPPNCYPRAGWVEVAEPEGVTVDVREALIPARRYRYELQRGLFPGRIDILNFFVLPVGPQRFGSDMRLVDRSSRSTAQSRLGAAQLQIITPAEMAEDSRRRIWEQTLDVVYPALAEIAEGVS